jgi:lysophospholipase L1-like esterase
MKNKYIFLSTLAIVFASCEPEFENPVDESFSAGDADFSSYVAVGNSLTAGYMDGTVSKGSQANSYPNILASGFAKAGGGVFTQPSYEEDVNNLGGFNFLGQSSTRLIIDASQGRPENIVGTPTITLTPQAKAFNNMGVPGAKTFHLLAPGYGNAAGVPTGQANPFYVRHATTPTATVFGDAMTKTPTFFTNWIGNNDILSYATSGGTKADGTPAADNNATGNLNPATYNGNDITNNNVFASVYNFLINGGTNPLTGATNQPGLTANGAKGVVCTIPSVTSIPYFTRVPFNALPAEATATNASAIGLYQFLAAVTGGRIAPLNTAPGSKNPVLMRDEDLADIGATISGAAATQPSLAPFAAALGALYGKARQATANDLIVLTASGIIGQPNPMGTAPFNVNGVTLPLANKWVLSANEKAKVASATAAYNATIVAIANAKNTAAGKTIVAVADMNAILNQLVSGLRVENGSIYTANYFSGSATEGQVLFSLDGVHPNARGYAVIANEITKVINAKFNAKLPLVNASYYPGINILATN